MGLNSKHLKSEVTRCGLSSTKSGKGRGAGLVTGERGAHEVRYGLIRDEVCGRYSSGDARKAFGFKGSLLKGKDYAGAMALRKVILKVALKSDKKECKEKKGRPRT